MWADRSAIILRRVILVILFLGAESASGGQVDWPEAGLVWKVFTLQDYNTRQVVISTILLGVTAGLVGTFLLLRRRSLMGDALSHATFPGIGAAFVVMILLGGTGRSLPGLLVGASVTGLLGVLLVMAIRNTTRLKDDAAMGIVLSVFFGVGVALIQMVKDMPQAGPAGLNDFIYGTAASMIHSDFLLILVVAIGTCLVSLLLLKELTLLCFDESFAASQGWPTVRLDIVLLTLVTAVTVIGLQAVGLVLIIAFLITPATAARFWTQRLGWMLTLSAIIGGVSGWLGASLSALVRDLPTGAVIVLVTGGFFIFSMLAGTRRGLIQRWIRAAALRRRVGRQHLLRAMVEAGEGVGAVTIDMVCARRRWTAQHVRRELRRAKSAGEVLSSSDGTWHLTTSGLAAAVRVVRNHRLWELFLIHYADIAPSHVDRDADLVEHVLDAPLVAELEALLEADTALPSSPHPLGGAT